MYLQPYTLDELEFAWTFRVYLRWRTYLRRPNPWLARLDRTTLEELIRSYQIHLLEYATNDIEQRCLLSLLPNETVAATASKVKGRISRWLRDQERSATQERVLGRGYFAATAGNSTTAAVTKYLERQAVHHGYDRRVRPPIFVQSFDSQADRAHWIGADHAVTALRFHLVFATYLRHGVFSADTAEAISDCWRRLQPAEKFWVDKVSFVPDHVHLAVHLHPSTSPANVAVALMNAGQELLWAKFPTTVIQARVVRLWQPSAYVGSFGDLASNAVSAYVRDWEKKDV